MSTVVARAVLALTVLVLNNDDCWAHDVKTAARRAFASRSRRRDARDAARTRDAMSSTPRCLQWRARRRARVQTRA
jgi:hypothetical protein